ncbi:prepilin-type N-terminal cleavage/methylation domain-containing protein [Candidatus Collierbacteria bacterium]|nr:prepilin-type N-terminal cleavage/methylation domain-containing protein [Candidatus Collierbacteria bacterium]
MKHGYSLIEILAAVTIIGILTGSSLVGYNRFQGRQGLKSAGDQLVSDLRLTQQKALSGEKIVGWCQGANESLAGWRLIFTSSTVYDIRGVCSSAVTATFKSITLPNSVTKSSGDSSVDFAAVNGTAVDASFILSLQLGTSVSRITVTTTSAGLVRVSSITDVP